MEDEYIIYDNDKLNILYPNVFENNLRFGLYGIFDGHGGNETGNTH